MSDTDTSAQEPKSFFKESEFICPCCGKGYVNPSLLAILEITRALFGKPIIIESGYRCPKHNKEVGGVPDSAHLTGEAADIRCFFAADRFILTKIFLSLGITRIGMAKNFTHIDISKTLPQEVIWLYGEKGC
jgi:hypothetical protein